MRPYIPYTFGLIWRQKRRFFFLSLMVGLDTVARLIQPYLQMLIVDQLAAGLMAQEFSNDLIQLIMIEIAIWFCLAVFDNIINAQNHYLVWEIGNVNSEATHVKGYKKLLRLDYQKHTQKHSSQYAKIVDEADMATWEMTNWWLGRFFPSIAGFIGMLFIALSVNWVMTLISLAVIPPGLALILFMIKRNEEEQHRVNKLWTRKNEHMSDQIANIITYKLNQDENLFLNKQKGHSDEAFKAQMALNKKWRLVEMLNPDAIARFMVMAVGVVLVKDGIITLGTLFMFMGLLNEILTPLHLLGDILPQYSRRARQIDRLLGLLEQPDTIVDKEEAKALNKPKGKLEFINVSFSYNGNEEGSFNIKNASFTISPGEHVALVGHSGAGKSTLMALITRLVDPTEGHILLDSVDIREYKQADYRAILGTVLQEHSLYNETVAENIAYGKPDATKEEIIAAAKKAAAHEFIMRLPKGYDTLIGERGVRLSGGEKQRLAIARAVLKDPVIVILDEPTSALDSITEAKVQKGLFSLIEGRTSLTIAHRLSTVRNADKILVLRHGELLAQGSHSALLRTCPEYAEMVELQIGGFLADE